MGLGSISQGVRLGAAQSLSLKAELEWRSPGVQHERHQSFSSGLDPEGSEGGRGDGETEKELGSSTQARGLPRCGNPTS